MGNSARKSAPVLETTSSVISSSVIDPDLDDPPSISPEPNDINPLDMIETITSMESKYVSKFKIINLLKENNFNKSEIEESYKSYYQKMVWFFIKTPKIFEI